MRDQFYVSNVRHMTKTEAQPRPPTTRTRKVPAMKPFRNGSTCGPNCPQHGRG